MRNKSHGTTLKDAACFALMRNLAIKAPDRITSCRGVVDRCGSFELLTKLTNYCFIYTMIIITIIIVIG